MRNKKIFVVDDDPFHLQMMQQILYSNPTREVTSFENGLDCLNQIHQNPDIIFLDHQMDVYSGYETLRKIKRHNPNIFVVMVSAQEEIRTAIKTLKHGAFDYLQKDEYLKENVEVTLDRIEEINHLLRPQKSKFIQTLIKLI